MEKNNNNKEWKQGDVANEEYVYVGSGYSEATHQGLIWKKQGKTKT